MRAIDTSNMKFLHRNVFSCGGANGAVAAVPVTVWLDREGALHHIPDDPAQLPVLKKLMRREMPDV